MELRFSDTSALVGVHRRDDGALIAEVPVARTGIQDYAGWEMGRPDLSKVAVYRPPEMVFADGYIRSMAHRPITDDHPKEDVTSKNWDGLAKGHTGETVRKDEANGLVYVPMMISDQKLIDKLEAGKREVSVGYTCNIEWRDGVTDDGTPYQAVMSDGKVNHVAVVNRGRAGSVCRVGDNWQPLDKEPVRPMKIVTYDAVPFEVADAALAGAFEKAIGERNTAREAIVAKDATIVERDASIVAKDAEIVKLKADLADAAITPAKLADAARSYATTMAKAKAAGATVTDSMSEADAHKAVVTAKMGDAAKDYTADQYKLAFDVLTKDAKVEDSDPLRDALRDAKVEDADKAVSDARTAMLDRLFNPLKADA